MVEQLDLLDDPRLLARRSDPITSKQAAARVHEFGPAQRDQILAVLRLRGPLGAEQIAAFVRLDGYAIRKRTVELQRAGLITLTGDTRRTSTGRSERIWKAVRDGARPN